MATTRIQLPVLDGGIVATHVYMQANDEGIPVAIEADSFRPFVAEHMSLFAREMFNGLAKDNLVALDALPKAGFALNYDEEEAALRLDVQPDALKTQTISLTFDGMNENQVPLENAALSGFVNLRAGQDIVHDSVSEEGRQPARLDTDGAVNLKGWVLEGRADYLEGSDQPWQRDDLRLVHDLPESMVRMALGDLSYPITSFQSFQPMLGFSFARNFSLQPYRVTEPTGQTSFTLASPSRVDVIVNGQRVRTLQLEPGPYDISDFPVSEGANDIELLITDASGRTERKVFPLISDQELLKAGLHEYAYNIGVESENIDREIKYETGSPVFSGFHRYGFTDALTAGLFTQADEDVQQAGFTVVNAHAWGTLGFEGAGSHSGDGADGAGTLSYQYQDVERDKNFAVALEYRGASFATLGQDVVDNPTKWEISTRYNQPIFYDINMGIGGRYEFMRRAEEDDEWSYSVNFNKLIFDSFSANLTWQHRSIDGMGVFAGVTWTPYQSDHTVSASVDTLTHTQDANWNWREGRRWQAGAGVTKQDDMVHKTGNAAYSGYRGEASIYHDVTTSLTDLGGGKSQTMTDRRTSMRVGTAIAFADDHVALSRPINSGFVMLTKHENLKGHSIGVNPENEDNGKRDYQARIDALGPAVLPDAVPYVYRPVRVDTSDLPDTYDIGSDNFVAMPSYKQGAIAQIGSAANIYVDGYLNGNDGAPIAMEGGIIREDGGQEQEFFTNGKGRFRISRMAPGHYTLLLNGRPGDVVQLDIPDETKPGKFDAGTLTLQKDAS